MDIILAIETSTAHGTVALYEVGKPLEVIEFSSDRSHNAIIFEPLQRLLKAGLPDLIVAAKVSHQAAGIRAVAPGVPAQRPLAGQALDRRQDRKSVV